MSKLNPPIMEVQIGIRELRTVKIYPLSIYDQLQMTDLLVLAFQEIVASLDGKDLDKDSASNIQFVEKILEVLKTNIDKFLELSTDIKENVTTKEITNDQFLDIANIIYEVNYSNFSKNLKDLTNKMKGAWTTLKKQSPQLSEVTQDTE